MRPKRKHNPPTGPAGTAILVGKDGPQIVGSSGKRWSDAAEAIFLDHLAATCNVTASAAAAGFSKTAVNARRRRDPGFAQRWQAALDVGASRIEALLLYRCEEALEGRAPDTELPIPPMSIKDALAILGHHRRAVERGPRSRRQWARPRSLDEMRDSILARLEAFVPHSSMALLNPPRNGEGDHPKDGGGVRAAKPMKRQPRLPRDIDIAAFLHSLPPEYRSQAIALMPAAERESLDAAWQHWAHHGQLAPPATASGADWSTWVIKAGRGFGKTLAGANWITARIAEQRSGEQPIRIALVGATIEDARRVMVEGPSGLIVVAARWLDDWSPSRLRLTFRTGAEATLFSGASPEMLRGPEHHLAWCDELAKWDKPQESWDNLQMGLRLGHWPRTLVTTTPRPGPVLAAILKEPGTAVTGGPTRANRHLSAAWRARMEAQYGGTRLGRQELEGELLPDAQGALWTVELIERCRMPRHDVSTSSTSARHEREDLHDAVSGEREGLNESVRVERGSSAAGVQANAVRVERGSSPAENPSRDTAPSERNWSRVLIAVDPPSGDGTCGIVAVARAEPGLSLQGLSPAQQTSHPTAHILADHSVTGRSPEGWARAVAAAAAAHGTTEVVAEANQGGKMVKAVLTAADPALRVRLVTAHTGKSARAEPVAHLCEAGRVKLHGRMPELEAQLLGMIAGGGYEGPGQSPDRADAMVWGVSEVMREVVVPRVRGM